MKYIYGQTVGFTTFLVLALLSSSVTAQDNKEVCSVLKHTSKEIQKSLPANVDYTTQLVGHTVLHGLGICHVQFTYLIDSDRFILDMTKESGYSALQEIAWLKTEEGQDFLKQLFQGLADEAKELYVGKYSNYRNMKFVYLHRFDKHDLPTHLTTILDTTM